MKRFSFQRVRISRVRLGALAAAVAILVALPLGILAIDRQEQEVAPRQFVVRGPTSGPDTPAARTSLTVAREAVPHGSAAQDVRLRLVERVRVLPSDELVRLVKNGAPLDRLSALHTLWVRGERAMVAALVAESGDRALVAKLEALRGQTK